MRISFTDKILTDYRKGHKFDSRTMQTDITGMSVLINPKPSADFPSIIFMARVSFKGKKYSYSIGEYPVLSLASARTEFLRIQEEVKLGHDPFPQRHVEPPKKEKVITVGELYNQWRNIEDVGKAYNTVKKHMSLYSAHISKIEDINIKDIKPAFMYDFFKPYMKTKEYHTIHRIADEMRQLLNFAAFNQIIEVNPLQNITKYLPKVKVEHHVAFSDDRLQEDMTKLFNDFSKEPIISQGLLQFYFYTLLRSSEARFIKVGQAQGNFIFVKTKTLDSFKVPLSTHAQKIVEFFTKNRGKRGAHNDFLFAGLRNGEVSVNTLPKRLKELGYGDKLSVHGIRTCGRQWLQTLPYAKESMIELCLSHTVGNKVEQSYNRGEYFTERMNLMQQWGDFVAQCVGNNNSWLYEDVDLLTL